MAGKSAKVYALTCFAAAALLGACHSKEAAAPPVESIDQSGDRITYQTAQPLKVSAVPGPDHHVRSFLNVRGRINYGEYVWSTAGVPPGPVWVLVDLHSQTLSVFRGQDEIGATVLLFGMQTKPTPVGRFKILAKDKDYWSRTYDAPMPYALRLTSDGVAIHGSEVELGSATHGCVGVPIDFARKLFSAASVGDEVVITRENRASTT